MRYMIFLSLILSICWALTSCSINTKLRYDKDIYLNDSDIHKLSGTYSCKDYDQTKVFDHFSKDTSRKTDFTISVLTATKDTIKVSFIKSDSIFKEYSLKGRIKKGYFRVNSRPSAVGIVGPLLWGLRGQKRLLGLTKENNLVALNSSGAAALVFLIPVFGTNSDDVREFKRIE